MGRLLFDELLALARKTVLAAIQRSLELQKQQNPWPLVLDATAGNGNDTEFLAQAVEENGLVLAFDVQESALAKTAARLRAAGLSQRVRLVQESHERLASFVQPGQKVLASMFNLGFLPGSDSTVTTQKESSLTALAQLEELTRQSGIISVHCYLGHAGGLEEGRAIENWMSQLPWSEWRVARYEFCNKAANQEILFLAQKL